MRSFQALTKIISWNIAGRSEPWEVLLGTDADIALLQEATPPPIDLPPHVEIDPSPWGTAGGQRSWKAAIVKVSDRVRVDWIEAKSISDAGGDDFAVSHPGTIAAAVVSPRDGEPFIAASMYGAWEYPREGSWIVADGTVHRVISDLSWFVGRQVGHRIIAAGDLNIYHGYGDDGSSYWKSRYDSVFQRMAAIGLPFVGPQFPNGRQADPWPDWLPKDSKNVPTYYHQGGPSAATDQLDFVFASETLSDSLQVCALNGTDTWGPSDHCKIEIVLA